MGHVRPRIQRRSRSVRRDGQSAVSPIIGSVLILVITILGIAGVLYWGAPMIERIQVQNAQTAMVGEFEDLRDSSRELSVPDHSRFPTIIIPRGQVSLQAGSRVMVTADQDAAHTGCDFHVLNWADTTAKTQVDLAYTGCLTPKVVAGTCSSDATTACLEVYKVSGATLSKQVVTACNPCASVTVAAADFSTGDWMVRMTDGSSTLPTPTYAQAWILSGDDVSWSTDSSTGKRSVTFDTGSIFSTSQGTNFLERPPIIGDSAFGSAYYGLWVRSLSAQSYGSISGAGSHQVYLSLIGNYDRVDSTTVYRLRYDIAGPLAQSWCNSLVNRNAQLSGVSYQDADGDASRACSTLPAPSTDGARGVCYSRVATNACSSVGSAFTFRFLHARIYTSLAV